MKIVAFTGLPRSGKDTAADYLVREHGFHRRQFSAPLKAAAAILLNREVWEMEGLHRFDREAILPEWGFSTRWFLQKLGTECLRDQIAPDFWIKRMERSFQAGGEYVITDLRFDNEAALVRAHGGVIIHIVRPGIKASGHVSDNGVKSHVTLANMGSVDELWTSVRQVIECF